jgi:hypothetical protein
VELSSGRKARTVSEYQYYEFQAVDQPLSQAQMAELRALSTRATITPTRFQNFYTWGDFRGNPATLMERYFDAFVYVANWGTHQLMLRLPHRLLDHPAVSPYCTEQALQAWTTTAHLVLSFRSEAEYGEDDDDGQGWMASFVPLRAELASGDLRSLYLGWLSGAQAEELDEDSLEPPVPPGLGTPSAALQALASFLRLDTDLLQVAAHSSAALAPSPSRRALAQWIERLSESDKTELLVRLVADRDSNVGLELLRRFQEARSPAPASAPPAHRRTVAELIGEAQRQADAKRRAAAERAARERARHERQQAAARASYLNSLIGREEQVWERIEALVATKQQGNYDEAVQLVQDVHDLADRVGQIEAFAVRLGSLRERHARKVSLLERLDRLGLTAPPSTQ